MSKIRAIYPTKKYKTCNIE